MFIFTASWWSEASNDISVDTEDDVVLLRCLLVPRSSLLEAVEPGVGNGFAILSCSSTFLNVSRRSFSERLGGRVIGDLCDGGSGGSWLLCERGDDGFEPFGPAFEFARGRMDGESGTHVCEGEVGREDTTDVDMTGVGAWICIERARVAAARTGLGTRPLRMMTVGGDGDVGVGVEGDDCADLVV